MIVTKRLTIRPYAENDAEAAHLWLGDPAVMRFIPGGHDTTVTKTLERVQKYIDHQEKHGFSKWIIMERHSGEIIGDAGLMLLPDSSGTELGYRIQQKHWGKGFATEAAAAWVNYGFKRLELNCINALVIPENIISIHILKKLNFKSEGAVRFYNTDFFLFKTTTGEAKASPVV